MGYANKEISSKFQSTNALSDWINQVRCKKVVIKRQKNGSNLRIAAVLTFAMLRAEEELQKKQQERVLKWGKLRMNLNEVKITEEEEIEQRKNVENLWSCELNGLDNFMNSLSQVKTVIVR